MKNRGLIYFSEWINILFGNPTWCRNWNRWQAELHAARTD